LFTFLAAGVAERNYANLISTFGIDECEQSPFDHGQRNIHQAILVTATGVIRAFLRILIDEEGVFEVEPVLLQVGFPLSLVPDVHDLIVATIYVDDKLGPLMLSLIKKVVCDNLSEKIAFAIR
jgi:hypothetical protein